MTQQLERTIPGLNLWSQDEAFGRSTMLVPTSGVCCCLKCQTLKQTYIPNIYKPPWSIPTDPVFTNHQHPIIVIMHEHQTHTCRFCFLLHTLSQSNITKSASFKLFSQSHPIIWIFLIHSPTASWRYTELIWQLRGGAIVVFYPAIHLF